MQKTNIQIIKEHINRSTNEPISGILMIQLSIENVYSDLKERLNNILTSEIYDILKEPVDGVIIEFLPIDKFSTIFFTRDDKYSEQVKHNFIQKKVDFLNNKYSNGIVKVNFILMKPFF